MRGIGAGGGGVQGWDPYTSHGGHGQVQRPSIKRMHLLKAPIDGAQVQPVRGVGQKQSLVRQPSSAWDSQQTIKVLAATQGPTLAQANSG